MNIFKIEQGIFSRQAQAMLLWLGVYTVIFIMVVSPAVLAHDVSARAGNVSMGIADFPTG